MGVLQFYDLSRITLITKVIGLMCDGQYKEMQNFLREQSESIQSINMVEEISSFLYEFSKKRLITSDTLPLLIEILQSLIELCSGNYKNNETIFNIQIISTINFILQIDITRIKNQSRFRCHTTVITNYSDLDTIGGNGRDEKRAEIDYVVLREKALHLKSSAVELLGVMLEEVSTQTKSLSVQIAGALDIHALHWSMVDFFELKVDKDLIKEKSADDASRALFKAYSIIRHLMDSSTSPENLSELIFLAHDQYDNNNS